MIIPKQRTLPPSDAAANLAAYIAARELARKTWRKLAAMQEADGLCADPFEYEGDYNDLRGDFADDWDTDRRIWEEIDLYESMARSNDD